MSIISNPPGLLAGFPGEAERPTQSPASRWAQAYEANKDRRTAEARCICPANRVLNPMPDGTLWCDTCGRSTHPKRTAEAQAQIDAARADPTDLELEAQLSDAAMQATPAVQQYGVPLETLVPAPREALIDAANALTDAELLDVVINRWAERAAVLTGAELFAYRAVQSAARAAHEAQRNAATTGATLRTALQDLCAVISPAKDPAA